MSAWPDVDRLREIPIDWTSWEGRVTYPRCRWISDGVTVVRRTAIVRPSRVEKLEERKHDYKSLVSAARVTALVEDEWFDGVDEGIDAKWVGAWKDEKGPTTYLALGDPDCASFYARRVRLLHLLTGFDRATWTRTRGFAYGRRETSRPLPLRAWKDGALVGVLAPVATDRIEVPDSIYEAARKLFPETKV